MLEGKTILVTGASSGLGAHFSSILAKSRAHVIMAARRQEALVKTADAIRAAGGSVETIALDVADPASIRALGPKLAAVDVLVNNAGITRERPALEQTEEDWDSVIDTNLKGAFLLAQATANAMRASGKRGGSIINISSIYAFRQGSQLLPYAVSKAGLVQMTKSLALEVARFGIRVNAIAPGYFSTEMNAAFWETEPGKAMIKRVPFRRLGQLDDLNGPLLLLASDSSSYMTGSVLVVDGGHLLSGL